MTLQGLIQSDTLIHLAIKTTISIPKTTIIPVIDQEEAVVASRQY